MSIIRLDLDALTRKGEISPDEAVRLKNIALPDTRSGLMVNLLLIFGAISVAAGTIALVPNAAAGLVLAILALGGAEVLRRVDSDDSLKVLGAGLAMMGALGLAGWIGWEFRDVTDSAYPALGIAAVLAAAAVWFRSSFLAAPAVLALGATLGSGTGYWHASYGIFVEEPTLTILVFGAVAAGIFALAPRDWRERSDWREAATEIPELVFTLGWAAFLITTIVRARRGGFMSVTSIVFLAIHGYTQYFELLGANATSLLIGGLVLVGLAVGGARYAQASRT